MIKSIDILNIFWDMGCTLNLEWNLLEKKNENLGKMFSAFSEARNTKPILHHVDRIRGWFWELNFLITKKRNACYILQSADTIYKMHPKLSIFCKK